MMYTENKNLWNTVSNTEMRALGNNKIASIAVKAPYLVESYI